MERDTKRLMFDDGRKNESWIPRTEESGGANTHEIHWKRLLEQRTFCNLSTLL